MVKNSNSKGYKSYSFFLTKYVSLSVEILTSFLFRSFSISFLSNLDRSKPSIFIIDVFGFKFFSKNENFKIG